VVLGRVGNEIHCLATVAQQLASPDLVQTIDQMDRIWKPDVLVFESNAAFLAMADLLIHQTRFGPKIHRVTQVREKPARIAAFAVTVQNGCFRLKGDGSQEELFREMTSFPFAYRDDLVDAAATGTNYLLKNNNEPRVWI
jgi:phage terminase large subunit-like protein